ncbi:DnaJ family molecular chaperone [Arcobacter sp. 15-2]|uniref:TerB family tellurite resistance protein n=1 Tax=Arcobacter sp. 15-2 TaxID=3374109 RepID=UPI00399C4D39
MTELLILVIVGIVFYMLNRGYKSSDYQNIQVEGKQEFKGNLKDHEAGLLVAMLAKVAKADGNVSELEAEILSHTFTDIANHFKNTHDVRDQLKDIYKQEMNSFDNTIEIAQKYYNLTKNEYSKRLKVMEYLLNLAFIDNDFSKAEFMITEDIANALEIKKSDFESLIARFEQFYAQKQNSKELSLEKACEVLDVKITDDMKIIKKKYRELVKKNHPDIITGQGASQSIIDEATAKLQEINESYELIKKEKNNGRF